MLTSWLLHHFLNYAFGRRKYSMGKSFYIPQEWNDDNRYQVATLKLSLPCGWRGKMEPRDIFSGSSFLLLEVHQLPRAFLNTLMKCKKILASGSDNDYNISCRNIRTGILTKKENNFTIVWDLHIWHTKSIPSSCIRYYGSGKIFLFIRKLHTYLYLKWTVWKIKKVNEN